MNIDLLRAKRLQEALGAVRELRHVARLGRRQVATLIRNHRMPARKLTRKIAQYENASTEAVYPPSYSLDDYISDLLGVLEAENERLLLVEKGLVSLHQKMLKRVPRTREKMEKRRTKRDERIARVAARKAASKGK